MYHGISGGLSALPGAPALAARGLFAGTTRDRLRTHRCPPTRTFFLVCIRPTGEEKHRGGQWTDTCLPVCWSRRTEKGRDVKGGGGGGGRRRRRRQTKATQTCELRIKFRPDDRALRLAVLRERRRPRPPRRRGLAAPAQPAAPRPCSPLQYRASRAPKARRPRPPWAAVHACAATQTRSARRATAPSAPARALWRPAGRPCAQAMLPRSVPRPARLLPPPLPLLPPPTTLWTAFPAFAEATAGPRGLPRLLAMARARRLA